MYEDFIRPHLDYGDIIYDDPSNIIFCQKIESVQYNAPHEKNYTRVWVLNMYNERKW